jgi:hypothetical protein
MLTSCGSGIVSPERVLNNFIKKIEDGGLGEMSLTIYYLNPFIFTLFPLDVDNLTNQYHSHKIIVDGNMLGEYDDLFNKMRDIVLVPAKQESHVDVRIYYIFKTKNNKRVLDVAMWGDNESIFVSGVEIEENTIFYDILVPYLPEEVVEDFKYYTSRAVPDLLE